MGRKLKDGVNLIWRKQIPQCGKEGYAAGNLTSWAGADEAYKAPNPRMRCAVAAASTKDFGCSRLVNPSKAGPLSIFPPLYLLFYFSPPARREKWKPPHRWLPANQLDPIYE